MGGTSTIRHKLVFCRDAQKFQLKMKRKLFFHVPGKKAKISSIFTNVHFTAKIFPNKVNFVFVTDLFVLYGP